MRPPPPIPRTILAALAVLLAAAGCQPGSGNRPVPSVPQIGADLNCKGGDHGYEDQQAGWGFCYPGSWRYIERSQSSESPPGLDLTFDITNYSCASPAPGGGAPVCSPDAGLFAFMVVSTYERGGAPDLATWIQTNLTSPSASPSAPPSASPAASPPANEPITWGNAVQAVKLADGRRVALTQHHVVIMDLRPGPLDLEAEMSSRLNTWKFSF